jgi:hypothetical protein
MFLDFVVENVACETNFSLFGVVELGLQLF